MTEKQTTYKPDKEVHIKTDDGWKIVSGLKDVKNGDKFKMFYSDGEPFDFNIINKDSDNPVYFVKAIADSIWNEEQVSYEVPYEPIL